MEGQWQESVLRRGFTPFVKRWLPRVVICLFIYFLSVRIISGIVSGIAFLSAKSGSLDLWNAVHHHPFARALLVGVLAGLIPMRIWLAVLGALNTEYENFLRELNTEIVKPWIWIVFSPLFVIDLIEWIATWLDMSGRNASVLQTTSTYHFSGFVRGYLSTDCSWSGSWPMQPWETKASFQCVMHVQVLSFWLLSIGYSLAPIVSRKVLSSSAQQPREVYDSEPERIEEPTMEGKTDQQ